MLLIVRENVKNVQHFFNLQQNDLMMLVYNL